MPRVTRSRTKADANGEAEKLKYTEPGSDVEDQDQVDIKPAPKTKPKAKYQRILAKKSVTHVTVQPKNDGTDIKGQEKTDGDVPDQVVTARKPVKKELGKHKAVETALKEEIHDQEPGNGEQAEADEFAKVGYVLSEKELKLINKAFDMNLPSLGDENLASANVKTAMRHLGYEPRVIEIRKLMKQFSNSKGKINRDGFHKIMAYKYSTSPGMNDKSANDEITKVFNLFDVDKTGKISLNALKSIAKELNEDLTDEDLLEMIAEADQDGDKLIDKIEFENIMKKTSLY